LLVMPKSGTLMNNEYRAISFPPINVWHIIIQTASQKLQ
jgi:hypothetical protein